MSELMSQMIEDMSGDDSGASEEEDDDDDGQSVTVTEDSKSP